MKCPVDGETLVMTERSGVEIDYCPKCRGIWLDRGELDKIIERAAASAVPPVVPAEPPRDPYLARDPYLERVKADRDEPRREEYRDRDRDHRHKYDDDRPHGKRKKRDGFLSDLFDF